MSSSSPVEETSREQIPSLLSTLRQRNFALVWLGGLISMTGDLALFSALPFYIFQQTNSTLASAGMVVATVLPGLLIGPIAGVFVDRWSRKWTMVGANLGRALILLLLFLINAPSLIWVVFIAVFFEAAVGQFFGPSENALLPQLVGKQHLIPANSLNALNDNLARFIGPALGGTLLGLVGLESVIIFDIATYIIGASLIALVKVPRVPPGTKVRAYPVRTSARVYLAPASVPIVWRGMWMGFRQIRQHPLLVAIWMIVAITALAGSFNEALIVAFVNTVVNAGPQGWGWVLTARGVGGLIGGLLVGYLAHLVPPHRLLGLSLMAVGAIFLAEVLLPSLPVVLALVTLVGVPVVGWSASQQTLLHSNTDEEFRGRIFSALGTTIAVITLVGSTVAGILGEIVGVVPLLVGAASLYFVAGAVAMVRLNRAPSPTAEKVSEQTAPSG